MLRIQGTANGRDEAWRIACSKKVVSWPLPLLHCRVVWEEMVPSVDKESDYAAKREDVSTKAVPFPPAQYLNRKINGILRQWVSNLRSHITCGTSTSAGIEIANLNKRSEHHIAQLAHDAFTDEIFYMK